MNTEIKKKTVSKILCSVVVVIFNKQNEILMFQRQGQAWECGWELIKGEINNGETEIQAVFRETNEEAGLKNIRILGRLPDVYLGEIPRQGGKQKVKARVFVCQYLDGEIRLGEPEHTKAKWMPYEEAREKNWLVRVTKGEKNMITDAYRFYLGLLVRSKPAG